jgi:hypothetical protein
MGDLRDILSNNDEQLNEDELMNYLEDNLSAEDKHAFEEKMADSQFVNDAIHGLKKFKNKQQLKDTLHHLNKLLEKQTASKEQRNQKKSIKELPMVLLTALLILLICIIGYFVIHLFIRHAAQTGPPQPKAAQAAFKHDERVKIK